MSSAAAGDDDAKRRVCEAQALRSQRPRLAHVPPMRGRAHYSKEIGIFTSGLPFSVILLSCASAFCCRILPMGA